MSEKQVRDYDKFMLRFPDGMRDAIAERAKQNGRSMNSEIIQALEDYLSGDSQDSGLGTEISTHLIEIVESQKKQMIQLFEIIDKQKKQVDKLIGMVEKSTPLSDSYKKKYLETGNKDDN
ncbi:Arc family DNA-binding protein [Klebsiella sp. CN_Kp091]|uniref:Arc family DNA-binding protein n=1 Tax=unclassified Klebsiella TaxID=2608929 RepID=UPI00294750CB|nr:Arc family DNA-binding protein [Raoultella ornithinolytica]